MVVGRDPSPPRPTSASRTRQYRSRRKLGQFIIPVAVNATQLRALVRLGYCDPAAATPKAVGDAIGQLLGRISPDGWPAPR